METKDTTANFTEIEVKRGIGSYFPIAVSLGITLYGFYLFLQTIIIDNPFAIYATVAFLGVVIIYIESHRANLLAEYLSAKLKKRVRDSVAIPYIGFVMAFAVTGVFVALDTWGALQGADSVERMLIEGIVKHSEQYKIEEAKAKSGVNEAKEYQQQLREWREAKNTHYQGCNDAWRVPTYRTKNQQCKDKFTEVKPVAVTGGSGVIPIATYEAMEAKAKADIEGYRVFFFWGFLAFSILLNYFAVSSFFTQYRKKRNNLNDDVVAELNNQLMALEALEIKKLQKQTEVKKETQEKKDFIDVELEKAGEYVSIAKRSTTLNNRRLLVNKIANKEDYTDMQDSKAGFVLNPFGDESNNNHSVKPNGYNQTVKPKEEKEAKNSNNDSSVNQTVITERLTDRLDSSLFTDVELELITILWDGNNVKAHDSLVTRKEVLKVIGDTKINTNLLRDLYKKLLKHDYIYKRVGYFAKVELER
jgi:hypothetical protein